MHSNQQQDRQFDSGDWKAARDHAWEYFALHAGQRMTIFNFFTILVGLFGTGIATIIQWGSTFDLVGQALSIILLALCLIFWKLDQRVSSLIKRAERACIEAEERLYPPSARLFALEFLSTSMGRRTYHPSREWTYGSSFRLLFGVTAIAGTISVLFFGASALGIIIR